MNQPMPEENNKTANETQPPKKSGGKFLAIFITVFALGFGALGAVMIRSAYTKVETYSASAEGEVIDYYDYSTNTKHRFSPIVAYRVGNQILTGETNVNYNYRPYQIGEYVTVSYNPENPSAFYIKGYDLSTTFKMGALFLFVSIGLLFVFILCFVIGRSKMDKAKKEQIQVKIIISAILLFMVSVFACVLPF